MITYQKLFIRDRKNKIRVWYIDRDVSSYRMISGIKDGKLVVSDWTHATKTNEGRSNERNEEQQAIFEIEAIYKKKKEEGYSEVIPEHQQMNVISPMLAHEYEKEKTIFPVFSQPKLDGIRCLVYKDKMVSRSNKEFVNTPHIIEDLQSVFENYPEIIAFDGELYNHSLKDDFNEIVSQVKKTKPNEDTIKQSEKIIQFHIYDIIFNHKVLYNTRLYSIEKIVRDLKYSFNVPTTLINSQEELDAKYSDYLEDGYEGQMIRAPYGEYEYFRSKTLLKRKEFMEDEYVIRDILPGLGNWQHACKRYELVNKDGSIFYANSTGTMEYNKEILDNKEKYINGYAKTRFFNLTPDGVPRFGRVVDFYEDLTNRH